MPSQSTWKVNVPAPPTACLLIFSDPVLRVLVKATVLV